jgi:iron complex outermembrane receptor protein
VFSTTVRNIWGDTSFTTIQPERLVDLQVGYGWESGALKGLSVLLQVNNATNEAYRTLMSVSDNTGAVPNLSYPAKFDRYGRQYLLGISYKM